jgi:xanthine/CO dehydrogenase XdhC/CoxF family maturation factor
METIPQLQSDLDAKGIPYVLATVVGVRGSVSANLGSQAIISAEGKNLLGWIGGGCAESFAIEQSLEALQERQARTITADLDDEVFGLGMPCGGVMDIFLDPRSPPEEFPVPLSETRFLSGLAGWLRMKPVFQGEGGASVPWQALTFARALGTNRGTHLRPLQEVKGVYARSSLANDPISDRPFSELVVLGAGRISESVCYLADALGWSTVAYGLELDSSLYPIRTRVVRAAADYEGFSVTKNSAVLIASHHKGDPIFLERALKQGALWVGLVASSKRSRIVFEHLAQKGLSQSDLSAVSAPAGLDLAARGPREIALSVAAELIARFPESSV